MLDCPKVAITDAFVEFRQIERDDIIAPNFKNREGNKKKKHSECRKKGEERQIILTGSSDMKFVQMSLSIKVGHFHLLSSVPDWISEIRRALVESRCAIPSLTF
jgi:hypothetical protein